MFKNNWLAIILRKDVNRIPKLETSERPNIRFSRGFAVEWLSECVSRKMASLHTWYHVSTNTFKTHSSNKSLSIVVAQNGPTFTWPEHTRFFLCGEAWNRECMQSFQQHCRNFKAIIRKFVTAFYPQCCTMSSDKCNLVSRYVWLLKDIILSKQIQSAAKLFKHLR